MISVCLFAAGCTSDTGEFDMTWTYGKPDDQWPEAKHIVLKFVDHPSQVVGIYSEDLGNYLDNLDTDTVPVTFRVHRQLGCVSSYSVIKIGDLQHWDDQGGYGGGEGGDPASPWDRWECWFDDK